MSRHGRTSAGPPALAPSAAEVVSAARVLLDALRHQPDQTPDVVEARQQVEQVIDRHDATPRFQTAPMALAPVDHAQHLDRHRRIVEAFDAGKGAGLCGAPGEYWPTGSIRIELEPCDRPAGHNGKHHWPTPDNLPPDLPPPVEPD